MTSQIKMLSKCTSPGQGSNDEFKHLIQVNARKFNLFESNSPHEMFLSKQAKTLFCQSFFLPVVCSILGHLVIEKKRRPLTHLTWDTRDGIFSHDWL